VKGNHQIINVPIFVFFFFFGATAPILGLRLPPWNSPFHFGLLDLRHSVGLLDRLCSSSQGLYVYTNTERRKHTHTHTYTHIHTHKHWTSIPSVEFDPTIPASERAKTLHSLDLSATVTGKRTYRFTKNTDCKSVITSMASFRNFEVIFNKFLVNGISILSNKLFIKLR
jgi:hypothetical protein